MIHRRPILYERGRIALTRTMVARKMQGRRNVLDAAELVELVMAKTLDVTSHARVGLWEPGIEGDDGEGEISGLGCSDANCAGGL